MPMKSINYRLRFIIIRNVMHELQSKVDMQLIYFIQDKTRFNTPMRFSLESQIRRDEILPIKYENDIRDYRE